ncbi:hypothetical protein [Microcoleus sp. B9-D4]|uniref:hypothetical protein n=1 Tax=Microcoleus sp. B9-D4 TaxID=2818711 RepID=UPI002FD35332
MVKKPGFFDRECVLECTENMRFSSEELTKKPGLSLSVPILLSHLGPNSHKNDRPVGSEAC